MMPLRQELDEPKHPHASDDRFGLHLVEQEHFINWLSISIFVVGLGLLDGQQVLVIFTGFFFLLSILLIRSRDNLCLFNWRLLLLSLVLHLLFLFFFSLVHLEDHCKLGIFLTDELLSEIELINKKPLQLHHYDVLWVLSDEISEEGILRK